MRARARLPVGECQRGRERGCGEGERDRDCGCGGGGRAGTEGCAGRLGAARSGGGGEAAARRGLPTPAALWLRGQGGAGGSRRRSAARSWPARGGPHLGGVGTPWSCRCCRGCRCGCAPRRLGPSRPPAPGRPLGAGRRGTTRGGRPPGRVGGGAVPRGGGAARGRTPSAGGWRGAADGVTGPPPWGCGSTPPPSGRPLGWGDRGLDGTPRPRRPLGRPRSELHAHAICRNGPPPTWQRSTVPFGSSSQEADGRVDAGGAVQHRSDAAAGLKRRLPLNLKLQNAKAGVVLSRPSGGPSPPSKAYR